MTSELVLTNLDASEHLLTWCNATYWPKWALTNLLQRNILQRNNPGS